MYIWEGVRKNMSQNQYDVWETVLYFWGEFMGLVKLFIYCYVNVILLGGLSGISIIYVRLMSDHWLENPQIYDLSVSLSIVMLLLPFSFRTVLVFFFYI